MSRDESLLSKRALEQEQNELLQQVEDWLEIRSHSAQLSFAAHAVYFVPWHKLSTVPAPSLSSAPVL